MVREPEKGVIVIIKPHLVIEILMPMEVNLMMTVGLIHPAGEEALHSWSHL